MIFLFNEAIIAKPFDAPAQGMAHQQMDNTL
jgi:hypothetical protein